MNFNSIAFACFLPVVFLLYWTLFKRKQWILLLISSYIFYMNWSVKYALLLLFTTAVTYCCGNLLRKAKSVKIRKLILGCAVFSCIGVLFLFKYINLFTDTLSNIAGIFGMQLQPITLSLLLPVGISFYTFQTLSYVIDVYYERVYPERHFGKYAAFISFFPQLVAGPIERTDNLLPQIKQEHYFQYNDVVYGLRQMLWGFYKKIVIADTLAYYVDLVYDMPYAYEGGALLISSLFFSLQIYCDFSGYSDIAIGTAKLFGINLMKNFGNPYLSVSINEFWKNWHISLSSWFRDYVYIPLGGNRKGTVRKYINILITFLLSGLWHGADMTFVLWGGVHGLAQIAENLFVSRKRKFHWLSVIGVFSFVSFVWIFFRANNIQEALYIIQHMFVGITSPLTFVQNGLITIGIGKWTCFQIAGCVAILIVFDIISLRSNPLEDISKLPRILRRGIYYALGVVLIICCFRNIGENQFVYFQF